jgi:predicted amidophosphoribosyltransferase
MPTCLSCKREYLTGHFYCRNCGADNTAWFIQHNVCPRCGAELKLENPPKVWSR